MAAILTFFDLFKICIVFLSVVFFNVSACDTVLECRECVGQASPTAPRARTNRARDFGGNSRQNHFDPKIS